MVAKRTDEYGYDARSDNVRRTRLSAYDGAVHKPAETGLDYFGARYFSSAQGRFTSPDAPFADQHPEDPQSWNLYGYVRNNPLRLTDPTGQCVVVNGRDSDCGRLSEVGKAEGNKAPTIGPVVRPRGGPLDRPIGAAKKILEDTIDLMSGGNPTEVAHEFIWWLKPRTDEEAAGGMALDSIQLAMIPFGGIKIAGKILEVDPNKPLRAYAAGARLLKGKDFPSI